MRLDLTGMGVMVMWLGVEFISSGELEEEEKLFLCQSLNSWDKDFAGKKSVNYQNLKLQQNECLINLTKFISFPSF